MPWPRAVPCAGGIRAWFPPRHSTSTTAAASAVVEAIGSTMGGSIAPHASWPDSNSCSPFLDVCIVPVWFLCRRDLHGFVVCTAFHALEKWTDGLDGWTLLGSLLLLLTAVLEPQDRLVATASRRTSPSSSRGTAVVCPTRRSASTKSETRRPRLTCSRWCATW